ncbi:MAG: hypothetical protein WC784_01830 [Candidatus Shapirobacteria bacterium]
MINFNSVEFDTVTNHYSLNRIGLNVMEFNNIRNETKIKGFVEILIIAN